MTRIQVGPTEIGRSTPASSSSGRFRPLITAAKALISFVTSAVATENADIEIMRSASRTTRIAIPPQLTWNPSPLATATTTASKTNIMTIPESSGPIRIAKRLAGVTRKSLDDARLKLEDRAEPRRHATCEREQRQDAGEEDVENAVPLSRHR